jgi:hypothetical protein
MAQFDLYVDRQAKDASKAIVRDAVNPQPVSFPQLIIGSSRKFKLFIVNGNDGLDSVSGSVSVAPTVAIGDLCAVPSGGTWTFTRGADTTSALDHDLTASALQTALEGLSSIGSGNVSVKANAGDSYRVEYIGTLADTAITDASADGENLTPNSTATVSRLIEGGSGSNEVQIVRLKQVPFVLQSTWTADTDGWTGTLSTGSWEALVELAASSPINAYVQVLIELSDGSVEKLALQAARILCDVSDPSQFLPSDLPTYLTALQVNGFFADPSTNSSFDASEWRQDLDLGDSPDNTIFVAKNGTDTRTGLDVHGVPFLTCTAALAAASSGDLIVVYPGDYSAESDLAGADGVNWRFREGAISPDFLVSGGFTFTINGDLGGFLDVRNSVNTVTLNGSVNGYIRVGDLGGEKLILNGARFSHDGTTRPPIYLTSSATLEIQNSRAESTKSGAEVVQIDNSWSGSLIAKNCEFVNTTVATNEATTGILYGSSVTGSVQLKDCTIITAQDGTGVAKSIDAPAAQTVYNQGTLNQTHAEDSDVTISGGAVSTNTNYTA